VERALRDPSVVRTGVIDQGTDLGCAPAGADKDRDRHGRGDLVRCGYVLVSYRSRHSVVREGGEIRGMSLLEEWPGQIVHVSLLDGGQDLHGPTDTLRCSLNREGPVGVMIVMHTEANLFEVVRALYAAGRLADFLHRRH